MHMGDKVFIFPIFQLPSIAYNRDQQVFAQIFKGLISDPNINKIRMASGYMNYDQTLEKLIKDSKKPIELLTASPQANSFFQAGRVKSWVPYLYRQIQFNLQKKLSGQIKVFEWQDGDCTFHSKGLWAVGQDDQVDMTVIGSTNFSYRSYQRDNECNLYMVSMCGDFNQRLFQESQDQFDKAQLISRQESSNKDGVTLGIFSWFLAKVFRSYL